MKPAQLKLVLSEVILHTNLTPLVWGSRGIGKSQICASLTRHLAEVTGKPWGLVDLRISTQELADLTGIPRPWSWKAVNRLTGEEEVITETDWSVPIWFPTLAKIEIKERRIPEHGIIFLDEINRGGHQETQAIFQFVLDRRIHTHQLASGWKIVAAANPPTEEYLVNEFDAALLDRFIHLNLKPDSRDWLEWANSQEGNISSAITGFIDAYPDMLCELSEGELNWSPVVKSSPRSWEGVNTILKHCRLPAEVEAEVLAGLIGNIPAVTFREFIQKEYSRPLKAAEIMEGYPACRESLLKLLAQQRMDVLNMITQDLIQYCGKNPEIFQVENFYLFFLDLPDDLKVVLVHSLLENEVVYGLMNNHSGLLAEISRIMNELGDKEQREVQA